MWLVYHTCEKSNGIYKEKKLVAVGGLLLRGLNHIALISVTFMAFKHADSAHVNQGVIAGLFTSGVVFTTIFFWLIYGEKITFKTFIGMSIIISGVISVGMYD